MSYELIIMETNNWKTYESIKCTLGTGGFSNLYSLTLEFLFDRFKGEVVESSTNCRESWTDGPASRSDFPGNLA